MRTSSLPDSLVQTIYVAALGVLLCPMTVEEKTKILQDEVKRMTDDGHILTALQTGLEPFDNAVMDFALKLEAATP